MSTEQRRNTTPFFLALIIIMFTYHMYTLYTHSKEVANLHQQLIDTRDMVTDAETSYYSGYYDGQSSALDKYDADLASAKRISYANGYSSAMIDMASSNDFANAYNDGFEDGWDTGYDEGYRSGSDDGYEFGKEVGYDNGYQEGHSDGYYEGYHDAT